jgi:hypothetical protein
MHSASGCKAVGSSSVLSAPEHIIRGIDTYGGFLAD